MCHRTEQAGGIRCAPHRSRGRVRRHAATRSPRVFRRPLMPLMALIAPLLWGTPALGQDARVGIGVGGVSARFEGPPTVEFDRRTGWTVGAFVDVELPVRPLDLRFEGRWSRRGGNEANGDGAAESDVLGLPLAVGPRFHLGRLSLFPFLGVEIAYPLASRRSPGLQVGFAEAAGTQGSGFAGASLDIAVPGGLRAGIEGRWLLGLNSAFTGSAGRLDLRAAELTLRLSRPFNP